MYGQYREIKIINYYDQKIKIKFFILNVYFIFHVDENYI